MNDDPVLAAALADISTIKLWCAANHTAVPALAVQYLAKNSDTLEFLLANLDSTTESQRAALQAANSSRLDISIVGSGKTDAMFALDLARQAFGDPAFYRVDYDDVNMLQRALMFVAHIDNARACPIELVLSPLQLP